LICCGLRIALSVESLFGPAPLGFTQAAQVKFRLASEADAVT
jgi:hypothetical protein